MNEHKHDHDHDENCRDLLSSLSEYVDGTLSGELCAILEEHVRGCQRCRIVVNTMKKTVELYHETAGDPQLPENIRTRLYKTLNLEDYQKK